MNIDGVYFNEKDWIQDRILWAYRFYPDGFLLFTYFDSLPPIVLTTDTGKIFCHTQDILGDKSKLPEFLSCFSRQTSTPITTRSGFPAVIESHYETDGQSISFAHAHFIPRHWTFSGRYQADWMVLDLTGRSTVKGEDQRCGTVKNLRFLRLN